MKRIYPVLALSLVLITASCTLFNTPPVETSPTELDSFRAKYLTSFDILNGTFSQSGRVFSPFNTPVADNASRATVPVNNLPGSSLSIPGSLAGTELSTLSDYPEVGQNSSWTMEATAVTDVYLVKVTTAFPSDASDPREKQEEWYYLRDKSPADADFTPDNLWTTADIVVDAAGDLNTSYRLRNWLYFKDGSIQYETIVDVRAKQDVLDGFAAFDVNGSMDYPDVFLPLASSAAEYSSVVVYTRIYNDAPAYSFWSGNRVRAIVGIRYYTEHLSPSTGTPTQLIGTTIAFEKSVTSLYGKTGNFLDAYSSLFLPYVSENPDQAFLALSVLRQQTSYTVLSYTSGTDYTLDYSQSSRDTRAKTRVVNIPTQLDNYISLINNEAAETSNAYDSFWIPQVGDPYLTSGTASLVETATSSSAVTTDDSSPVDIVLTSAPVGELGQFYVGVTNGTSQAIVAAESNGIPGDLIGTTGTTVVKDFNGSQGFVIESSNDGSLSFNDKGTVQAWLYVDRQSKNSGIVHAGIKSDFSDELWSLQLIGNNNTPSFSFAAHNPDVHDLVQSSEKLRKSTWYHLAVTWNRAAGINKMTIYVNGVARGSKSFSNTPGVSTFAPVSPIVVGSMFYDETQVLLTGYYGIDGKITGVLIENQEKTPAEIAALYAANVGKTAFW